MFPAEIDPKTASLTAIAVTDAAFSADGDTLYLVLPVLDETAPSGGTLQVMLSEPVAALWRSPTQAYGLANLDPAVVQRARLATHAGIVEMSSDGKPVHVYKLTILPQD